MALMRTLAIINPPIPPLVLAAPELEAENACRLAGCGEKFRRHRSGELITYTIIVRNIGNQEALTIPLVDKAGFRIRP